MEDMDDLYTKIQVYLMKKDKECGKLRFLTSRTTEENSRHVQDVCDTIREILEASGVPVEEESSKSDRRCVQAFKYLVLNTLFESQEHLAEDLVNGHLVDMCPPFSPYLLTEILWSLGFEEIVAESILHMPLDLCVEILGISRRCVMLLDFQRALDFVATTALNCYRKMIIVGEVGTQAINLDEGLELLTIHWQELMALFSDPKFLRLEEVAGLKKSERRGLILKKILALTRDSLESIVKTPDTSDYHSIYNITFGRAEVQKSNDDFASHLRMLDQEFAHLLLKKLKEVDCNTYLDWASLEAAGKSSISMQQSIGNDCYSLIEFIGASEHLVQHDHLIECLQQLSSKPKPEPSFSEFNLEELRREAENGSKECVKELMNRYREWDHETFDVVRRKKNLLDKDDFLNLLEYLTLVMTKPAQEEHKQRVYTTVTRVLLQQNIPDLYETILEYILRHDGRNTLESKHTEESFKHFMAHNKNFKSPKNLRIVLFFLLKNPRKILSILLRIAIGDPEFSNVMVSPTDLCLLSPVMNIRENREDDTLLLSSLRSVCIDGGEWNSKKFPHLVEVLLENCIITGDKMVNNVLIPYLNERVVVISNLGCVLNCLRKLATLCCTKETRVMSLLEALAKRMSWLRNDIHLAKYSTNELLTLMARVVEIFLRKSESWLDREEIKMQIERIEASLEPVDRHHFARLLSTNLFPKIDVFDTIREYERRCFVVINRLEANREIVDNEEEEEREERRNSIMDDLSHFHDHFLRHLIVKATEKEYVKFATEATIIEWKNFRCKDEYEAYKKIVGITIEACVYSLEYPELNSPDCFACLMRGLARFTRGIASLEEVRNADKLYEALVDNVRALDKCARNTVFASHYTPIILSINNRASHEPVSVSLRELTQSIDNFGNKCLEIPHNEVLFHRSHSPQAARYRIAHEFLNECVTANDDASYQSLCRIYKLLSSPETPVDVF